MARILFIDDDDSIRFLVQEELSIDGHQVRVAADGPNGLLLAEQELPDLVILDLKMPGMDGLEVLRRLKLTHPSLPVYLFTAYNDYSDTACAMGADGYFVKSADLGPLRQRIRSLTE